MKRQILVFFVLLTALALLAACVPVPTPTPAGIPNPASVNCVEQGGKLEVRSEAGGQAGYCRFADGSECEEWALMRGECAPGAPGKVAQFTDPFAYCAAAGTLDKPDARYTGPKTPDAVV